MLAVAAPEGTSLWDLATHKQIGALMEGRTANMAFSPDGQTLAAIQEIPKEIQDKGITDEGIALWDVGTTELLGWLPAGEVSSLSFSPDGNTLLTSSRGVPRTFTLWDLNVNSWKARACAISNRNFTSDEWEYQFGKKMPYRAVCPNTPEPVAVQTDRSPVEGSSLRRRKPAAEQAGHGSQRSLHEGTEIQAPVGSRIV